MMKYIGVSYKSLYSIVEAVEQKIVSDQEKYDASANEGDRADLENDIVFMKAYLPELKSALDGWLSLSTKPR